MVSTDDDEVNVDVRFLALFLYNRERPNVIDLISTDDDEVNVDVGSWLCSYT